MVGEIKKNRKRTNAIIAIIKDMEKSQTGKPLGQALWQLQQIKRAIKENKTKHHPWPAVAIG